ncbi:hypothetical protein ABT300_18015 [Streptomyces sp. NPDC001027]|uniref:hypothetical protein n=1 Tax=Streptomyces sp. NPDC001027 TaxID=3154771 RepID=UPI0033165EF6
MCLYLLHGSVERIPGLLVDSRTLSFEHLSRRVRAVDRWSLDDSDTFSLYVKKKVHGRLYGLAFKIHFLAGEPYADAVIPFGATVDLPRFMHRLRGRHASQGVPGDWDFDVFTDVRDLSESVVLFGNRREVWFQADRRAGRLVTGRLHGNRFGTSTRPHGGGVMFPDRLAAVPDASAEARAYRRHVARLRDPLPLPARLRSGPGSGVGKSRAL